MVYDYTGTAATTERDLIYGTLVTKSFISNTIATWICSSYFVLNIGMLGDN